MPDTTQRTFRRVVVAGIVLALIAFASLWYAVIYRGDRAEQAQQAAAEACQAANRNLDAVADVFVLFREAIERANDEPPTEEEQGRADEFFAAVTTRLDAARCTAVRMEGGNP